MALPPLPTPDSFMFQHEETGQTMFVDSQQVEWGFEKNNPRLQKICGVFTERQMSQYAAHSARLETAQLQARVTELEEYITKLQSGLSDELQANWELRNAL